MAERGCSSSPPGRAVYDMNSSDPGNREREVETKTKASVFFRLILEMTYYHFCHFLSVILTTAATIWEGPYKGLNTRVPELLETVLETIHHRWTQLLFFSLLQDLPIWCSHILPSAILKVSVRLL